MSDRLEQGGCVCFWLSLSSDAMWEDVRKFGLGYCDLPTMMWNVSFLLRGIAINIDTEHKQRIPLAVYAVTGSITVSYVYAFLISLLWFLFARCTDPEDFQVAMVVFSLGISSEIGSTKFFNSIIYIKELRKLFKDYLLYDATCPAQGRLRLHLLTTLRYVKRRAIIYWLVIIGNGFIFAIKPLLVEGRHLAQDDLVLIGLEPMRQSPNYEIAYAIMTMGVCFICYPPAHVTMFLIIIVGYTEAQMLALSEELKHLWNDAIEHYEKHSRTEREVDAAMKSKILNSFVNFRLVQIIKSHSTNVNLIGRVENVFRGSLAVGYVFLIVGLIAELLGGLENTYLQVPFALIQVAIDCFIGQRVNDANIDFEKAVYDCKWENFDKRNMKIVLLLLQNAQKTVSLSAGGIAKLNFSCFMSVIKSIYSAYTTLRTTMK